MTDTTEIQKHCLIRVVDDDIDHCKAMQFLLTCRGWKTTVYTGAEEYLRSDTPGVPGVLVLDVRMPEITGLELQSILKERSVKTPIIFLSGFGDIDMAVHTLHEGAVDFLQKPVNADRLTAAVEKAARQSLSATDPMLTISPKEAKERLAGLTERERQILELTGLRLASPAVGKRLGISDRTVQAHKGSAAKKSGLHSMEDIQKLMEIAQR